MLLKTKTMAVLTACLVLTSSVSYADWAYANDTIAVVVRKSVKCTNAKVLATIAAKAPDLAGQQWAAAEVTTLETGKKLEACWLPFQNVALIVDEDGDGGYIEQFKFRELKDA